MKSSGKRVVAVTQSDPFFTGSFFQGFAEECPRHGVELVEIVLLPNFNESRIALARRFAKLYGLVDFLRLLWRYLRVKVSERLGSAPRSVEAVASRHGIPLRSLGTINDEEYLESLRERDVDVLLSVSAPEIFRASALKAAPYVLNVHSGKLPDYRGMMPTFWALHDGVPEITVTVHEMAERIDSGGLIAEFEVPVEPADSAFDLAKKAKLIAGHDVPVLLSRIGTPEWPQAREMEVDGGSYRSFPTRQDVRQLRARGRRML